MGLTFSQGRTVFVRLQRPSDRAGGSSRSRRRRDPPLRGAFGKERIATTSLQTGLAMTCRLGSRCGYRSSSVIARRSEETTRQSASPSFVPSRADQVGAGGGGIRPYGVHGYHGPSRASAHTGRSASCLPCRGRPPDVPFERLPANCLSFIAARPQVTIAKPRIPSLSIFS